MTSLFPDLFFQYFDFLAFGLSLLSLLSLRGKASHRLMLYHLSYSALFLTWGVLQLAGGYKSPFFVFLPPQEHPLTLVFWVLYFVWLWTDSTWVIWGGGAEELSGMASFPANTKRISPQGIKRLHVFLSVAFPVLVLAGLLSGFFNHLAVDTLTF